MLSKVSLGELFPSRTKMLFHGGIYSQFFTDGMTSQVPDQHVPPFDFIFCRRSSCELVVALVEITVVLTDGLGDEHVDIEIGNDNKLLRKALDCEMKVLVRDIIEYSDSKVATKSRWDLVYEHLSLETPLGHPAVH